MTLPFLTQNRGVLFMLLFFLQFNSINAKISTDTQKQIESLSFRPLPGSNDLFIATDSLNNNWIRGEISNNLLYSPLIFQFPNAHIFEYDLYFYNLGVLHEIESNVNTHNDYVVSRFAHYYIVTDNPVFYANLYQNPINNLTYIATERSQFASHEAKQLLFIGNYYGIASITIIINLIFFLIFKDKRFLSYTALQICIFISLFYEDGMFYYLSKGTWEMPYLLAWNVPLTSLLACVFTVYFLDFNVLFKQYKVIFISLFSTSFLFSIIYTLSPDPLLMAVIILLSFISPFFCLVLAATQIRKNVYARFLLTTFSIVILFGIGYILHMNLNIKYFDFFTINMFRLVCALEIIIITFAIIYKVKELQDQNSHYRNEIESFLSKLDKKQEQAKIFKLTSPLQNIKIKYNLTSRESEVLTCIWEGMSNIQISDKLCISVSTVKYHVNNLYSKLEINSRSQALDLKKTFVK